MILNIKFVLVRVVRGKIPKISLLNFKFLAQRAGPLAGPGGRPLETQKQSML